MIFFLKPKRPFSCSAATLSSFHMFLMFLAKKRSIAQIDRSQDDKKKGFYDEICFQFVRDLAFQMNPPAQRCSTRPQISDRVVMWSWITCMDDVIVLVSTIVLDIVAPTPIHCLSKRLLHNTWFMALNWLCKVRKNRYCMLLQLKFSCNYETERQQFFTLSRHSESIHARKKGLNTFSLAAWLWLRVEIPHHQPKSDNWKSKYH